MKYLTTALILSALLSAGGALGAERQGLGWGRLFNNDFLGDGQDRWRSGSYTISHVRGPGWDGTAPESFGALLEYRLRGEVIAPENLTAPAPGDRPYAGVASYGLYTHMNRGGTDLSFGGELVFTGPQTMLDEIQTTLHDVFDRADIDNATATQIENGIYPTVTLSAGRDYALGARTRLRPFVEAQAGVETYLRVGGDLQFGSLGESDLWLRDKVTGHRYNVARDSTPGYAFVLGGDIAYVADSHLLPSDRGYQLTDSRNRLRAGVHYQGGVMGVFYGLTWLGTEFEGQDHGQVTGSLNLRLNF